MARIKWSAVLTGGLMAGFVANLLQFTANRLYLRGEWLAAGAQWNQSGSMQSHLALLLMTFAGGILTVFLYSVVRAWLGPGPKSAAIAGMIFWSFAWLYPVMTWILSGGLPSVSAKLWAYHLATYLVIAILQTEAGAWIYKGGEVTSSGLPYGQEARV